MKVRALIFSLLAIFLISLIPNEAKAIKIIIQTKKNRYCLAWGAHNCGRIIFNGGDDDISLTVNNATIKADEINIVATDPRGMAKVSYVAKSASKTLSRSPQKRKEMRSNLSNIMIMNRKTGEKISLRTFIAIQEAAK